MVGLVALITLVALIIYSRHRGDTWPIAILTGVRKSMLGMMAVYGLIIVLAVGLGLVDALLRPVANAVIGDSPGGQPPASRANRMPAMLPTTTPEAITLSLPTPTPRVVNLTLPVPAPQVTMTPTPTPTPTPQAVEVSPTSTPPASQPASTPADARTGCDPAYPDAETCIPPGPPWDQGCGITDERRFTVLPPDPQRLDHDNDGIGCEPIA